ncbi:MAG: histidine phosphatase family protein [Cystobacter sp.]
MTTEFLLLRHGETEWNAAGRLQGHLNSSLSRQGLRQADALAERLSSMPFQALYSSDLDRAVQTASRIAERTGHALHQDARWRERGLGVLQGLTRAEAEQQHPESFAAYAAGGPDFVIPQGESASLRLHLVLEALAELSARHGRGRVVVVTHGGVLSGLLRHCLGVPPTMPRTFSVPNAGWNQFDRHGDSFRLVCWGDVSHLGGLGLDDTSL